MSEHDEEKLMHENSIIKQFLQLYNQENDTKIAFIRHGDPLNKEPDGVCSENIYIEMVDMFSLNSEAAERWNQIVHKSRQGPVDLVLNTNQRIQELIYMKSQKLEKGNYDGMRPNAKVILLCNLESFAVSDPEVASFIDYFYPLSKDSAFKRYFDEVWLIWKSSLSTEHHIQRVEI